MAQIWKLLAVVLVLGGGAALGWRYHAAHRDDLPSLGLPDIRGTGAAAMAGSTDNQSGDVFLRPFGPADLASAELSPMPAAGAPSWTAVRQGSPIPVASLFRLGPKGMAQVSTLGGWIFIMDGDGEFVFEAAQTDKEGMRHTAVWHLKRGSLRVSSYPQEGMRRNVEIRAPGGIRILLGDGELGVRSGGVGGQLWVLRGSAVVRWPDGRRAEISQPGLNNL